MLRRLLSVLIFIIPFSVFAQIPNGDFELWETDSIGLAKPTNWTTTNVTFSSQNVFQDAGRNGGSAVKISSAFNPATNRIEGGQILLNEQNCTGSPRPTTMSGYWKISNPSSNSILGVDVYFYDASHTRVGLGSTSTPLNANYSSWTPFTLTINYSSSNPIVSYKVDALLGIFSTTSTAYGVFDDFAFDVPVNVTGIQSNNINVSSINANGSFHILGLEGNKAYNLKVFNLTGQTVKTIDEVGREDVEINLNEFQAGLYYCELNAINFRKSFRLLKTN